ncbi:MAG: DNA polymerase III subunit alpha [Candidatus Lokiarchaeota archaeon]|nr:DNA polymerase III subunit alpha [Candidatus Lokiarchaeota archaeon]
MKYTPLHVHSEYSLLDGLSKCDDISKRIEEIGATSCALTDHGTVSGAVDFSNELRSTGFQPLLGCEMYICNGLVTDKVKENRKLNHQVVIAKNAKGWSDLLSLVSLSNKKEHFYHKPRVDIDILAAIASQKNLVSFSGHLGSTLANAITEGERLDPDWMKKGVAKAKDLELMFGKGNFFIEIQLIDSKINKFAGVVANALRQIAKVANIPCVATPDAHYCRRQDAEDQRVLLCTALKKSISQVQRELKSGTASNVLKTSFMSNNYHIPSYDDMKEFHTDEELQNTNLILDMCEDYDITKSPQPPEFKCPEGLNPEEYLRKLCRDGWKKKMASVDNTSDEFIEYGKRINNELDIFTSIGLSSYFLIVDDILQFVRSKGYITGPGRGSAAGCMVSNLLSVTQVDPIPYNLIFERFYNAGRNAPGKISWPDIDFDIPKAAREETIEYIKNKYGEENVAQIITFQKLKGKAALTRTMAARGNISFEEQKAITKCLPEPASVSDELQDIEEEYGYSSSIIWALENTPDKLKNWCYLGKDNKLEGRFAKIFEQAIRIEHTKIIAGKHAAGIVISSNPISKSCPMVLDNKGKGMLAGFEGPSCEEVGLLKLDCLAIRGLDKVMDVVNIVGGEN